jgi:hypothetical protein
VLVYVVLTGKIRHKINAKYETITTGRNIQYLGKPKLAAWRNIFEGIECFGFGALKQSLSLSFFCAPPHQMYRERLHQMQNCQN